MGASAPHSASVASRSTPSRSSAPNARTSYADKHSGEDGEIRIRAGQRLARRAQLARQREHVLVVELGLAGARVT